MKLTLKLLLFSTLFLGGCALLNPGPRSWRFENCSVRLFREGYPAGEARESCKEAHGSILDREIDKIKTGD